MPVDDDDKPTVVLDLNALKKMKLEQEEDLANMVQGLEFVLPTEDDGNFDANHLDLETLGASSGPKFPVILFDFQSDFFQQSKSEFPRGFDYKLITNLNDLNKLLANKQFQIVLFNYDANPKAVNQLTAQIKLKFPFTKTMIMARSISPEKARMHAQTKSGANSYYQLPLDSQLINSELLRIHDESLENG